MEWLEDVLNPATVVSSTAMGTTTEDNVTLTNNDGRFLQPGDVLMMPTVGDNTEYVRINSITYNSTTNTLTVTRSFGGTVASSYAAGQSFRVLHSTALEGSDVSLDISQPRSRKTNYCQIMKKDIIVSGTQEAVTQLGNITSEYTYQQSQRMREVLRDLEQATFLSVLSGNTLGSATAYRTMQGLWSRISTNSQSLATLTESWLGSITKKAWDNGGSDIDVIAVDANWKRIIDTWNSTRTRTDNAEMKHRNLVSYYEGTFGVLEVMLCRWMRASSLIITATPRVRVLNLQGRSFAHKKVSITGDSQKGMIIGEYTTEIKNEKGMAKGYAG